MVKSVFKNFAVFCFVWSVVGSADAKCSRFIYQSAPPTRAFSLQTSLTVVTDVLQNVATVIAKFGPVISGTAMPNDPVSAIQILGQVMQVAADVQKKQNEMVSSEKSKQIDLCETRSKKQCGCPCRCVQKKSDKSEETRSFLLHASSSDRLMYLVIKTAQLPGVTDKSALWILKNGVVRTPPVVLFQQIVGHKKSRKKLFKDFFTTLRSEVAQELKEDVSTVGSVEKQEAWTAWEKFLWPFFSCLIDIVQKIVNQFVDDAQLVPKPNLSPAVSEGMNAVIDGAQVLANAVIDEQQLELFGASAKDVA